MNRIDQTIGELLGKLKAARGKLRRGKAALASLREQLAEAQRQLAALKAQGCETCAHQGLRLTPDIYCALHEDMAARFGNRCGRWTPAPPSGAGKETR